MDRLGELEMLSRCRELDPFERAELIRIIRDEKRRTYQRNRYRRVNVAEQRRKRYQSDPAYRAGVLEKNERSRLRRAGRL